MVYLSGFRFPDRAQEANYMAFSPRARQTCYDSYYPFGLFEGRTLPELDFLEITILYGGNGSGKTTLLNVMADALRLYRRAEYNRTPFFDDYARLCEPRTMRPIPTGSMILTSDDVFDYMLDLRALNDGVDTRREQMFADYNDLRREKFQMHGMKDYDRLKQVSAAAIQPIPDGTPHAARQCAHPLQRRERIGRVQRTHPRERAVFAG